MSAEVKAPLAIVAIYLWIGFVCAISFMEAWLKFRAPGVNLQIGLSIGRIVFNALNKVEWVFAAAIVASFFVSKISFSSLGNIFFYIPVIVLVLQTMWLLPALDARAEMHIKGMEVPSSGLHFYYIIMEITKTISLFIFSFNQFK